jgi:hypothetical protein
MMVVVKGLKSFPRKREPMATDSAKRSRLVVMDARLRGHDEALP